jgi:hypothetical protein
MCGAYTHLGPWRTMSRTGSRLPLPPITTIQIAEENNVLPQRYLQLSLPTIFILPHAWSIGTNYKAKVNFENGERWTHTVDVGLAKRLSNVPLVLSATFEKPLKGGNKRFQVNFTMTYYFERYHLPK